MLNLHFLGCQQLIKIVRSLTAVTHQRDGVKFGKEWQTIATILMSSLLMKFLKDPILTVHKSTSNMCKKLTRVAMFFFDFICVHGAFRNEKKL